MIATASSAAQPRTIAAPMPFAPPVTRTTFPLSCRSIRVNLQIVKTHGVGAENLFLRFGRFALHEICDDVFHLLVARSQETDRPIGTKHQSVHPKSLKYHIKIRTKVRRRPAAPVGFGHQP